MSIEGRRRWTQDELARATEMKRAGATANQVARALGRTFYSVRVKLQAQYNRNYKSTGAMNFCAGARAPDVCLEERDRRIVAELRRDLTGTILGDPPPGFSALDKKRADESRPENLAEQPSFNISAQVALSNKPWSLR